MKIQHVKFEILKERLCLFQCNLIQHKFVLNMFSTGQICKENDHSFGDDITQTLDVSHSKFLNQMFQAVCDLTR